MKYEWDKTLREYRIKKNDSSLIHRFVNHNGLVINTNDVNLKTSFKYLGKVDDFRKNERLLMVFNKNELNNIRKESKTEFEYFKKLYLAASKIMFKDSPIETIQYKSTSAVKRIYENTMITKDTFLSIVKSKRTTILDWDLDVTKSPVGTYIKYELFYR